MIEGDWTVRFPNATTDTVAPLLVDFLRNMDPLNPEDYIVDGEIVMCPLFVSDSLDVGTSADGLTPVGLGWNRVKNYCSLTVGAPVDTVLLCEECDESFNVCSFGECVYANEGDEKGTCECIPGFEGLKCEHPTEENLLDFLGS